MKSRVLRCVALRVRLSELCARVPLPLWDRDFYEHGGPPCKLACVSAEAPSHPTRAMLLLLLRVLRLPLLLLLVLLLLLPCTAAAVACPAPHPARVAAAAAASARAAAAAGTTGARAPKRRVDVDETEEAAPATPSKLSHAGRNIACGLHVAGVRAASSSSSSVCGVPWCVFVREDTVVVLTALRSLQLSESATHSGGAL